MPTQTKHPQEVEDEAGQRRNRTADLIREAVRARITGAQQKQISIGRYRLIRTLGRGGMGIVYEAHDPAADARVALKTLRREDAEPSRLRQEFRVAADLSHPNLVALYDFVAGPPDTYFTMELIAGENLRLPEPGGLGDDPTERIEWMKGWMPALASAVEYLHAHGRVHGDIKPENIMLDGARPVLLDFGLSQRTVGIRDASDTYSVGGTPAFMAPEVAQRGTSTAASDCYALGAVIYQLLTGEVAKPASGEALTRQRAALEHYPAAVRDLCLALLDPVPEARPGPTDIARTFGRGNQSPSESPPVAPHTMVGRQHELASLWRAQDASAGAVQVAVLRGSSGMGKTTLAQAFVDALPADVLVLRGVCYEREAQRYQALEGPALGLLDAIAALPLPESLTANLAGLLALFPNGASRLEHHGGLVPLGAGDPAWTRSRAALAVGQLLSQVAERRPVLLYIDDLQWGDSDSAWLLERMLSQVGRGVCVLACVRDAAVAAPCVEALLRAVGDERYHELRLGPLSDSELHELARRVAPDVQLPLDLSGAEGHPLLATEMMRLAAERARAGDASPRPTGISGLIAARCANLEPTAAALLDVLAVCHAPIPVAVALGAAELHGSGRSAVNDLRARRLVQTSGGGVDAPIDLYHDSVRRGMRSQIDDASMRRLHESVARAFERLLVHPPPATLYLHWLQAGDEGRASHYAAQAAHEAQQALSFERAIFYCEEAQRLCSDRHERTRLSRMRADLLSRIGRSEESARAFLSLAQEEPSQSTELYLRAAGEYLGAGDLARGEALLRRLLPAVGIRFPETKAECLARIVFAQLRARFGHGYRYTLQSPGQVPAAELRRVDAGWIASERLLMLDALKSAAIAIECHEAGVRSGDPHRVACSLASAAASRACQTMEPEPVWSLLDRAKAAATHSEDPRTATWIGLMEVGAHVSRGEYVLALPRCAELEQAMLRQSVGVWSDHILRRTLHMTALIGSGHMQAARERCEAALLDALERGNLWDAVTLRVFDTKAQLAAGNVERAEEHVAAIARDWHHTSYQLPTQHWFLATAWLALYRGDAAGALTHLRQQWPRFQSSPWRYVQAERCHANDLLGGAAAQLYLKDGRRATRRVALGAAKALEAERYLGARESAARIRALLLTADGRKPQARQLFAHAIAGYDRAGLRFRAACTRYRYADVLPAAQAETMRERAVNELAECGASHAHLLARL